MTATVESPATWTTDRGRNADERFLIVGGTGKTGGRVAARLADQNVEHLIASRSGPILFDWDDPSTWRNAVAGATSVYLTYAPDIAVPGAVKAIGTFVDIAKAAGVRRVVLLSGRGETEALHAEEVVQASGLEWTILRCSWFAQNFSENFFVDGIRSGELVLPVAGIPEPFLDAEDIADAAVLALTEDDHVGRLYELTGPRLLTFDDAVSEISLATGRAITFTSVTPREFSALLESAGVPESISWLLNYLFTEVMDGRNAYVTDGVQQVLGRPPRDFADYARTTASSGIWDQIS